MTPLPARALFGCLAAGVLTVGAVPSASSSPVRQNITIEDGFVADFLWESCVPQDVTVETDAPTDATALPALGPVEGHDDVVVSAVDVSDGLATWTLAPSEQDCAPGASAPISPIDFTEPLRLRWKERRYVLKATEKDGVRRIAGWDTTYSRGHNPSVASARRYFGRPSKVTKGRSQDCRLTWNPARPPDHLRQLRRHTAVFKGCRPVRAHRRQHQVGGADRCSTRHRRDKLAGLSC
ncbi:MAG: hypothetical protein Q7T55_10280 [Solirubrobacteraceae bacterium]|nr:hypothetical protein [Solirubrobacteraceae bacterium]